MTQLEAISRTYFIVISADIITFCGCGLDRFDGFPLYRVRVKWLVIGVNHFIRHFQLTNAKVKAIMNDTVGQLAAAAFKYGTTCTMGVVIGYGLVLGLFTSGMRYSAQTSGKNARKRKKRKVIEVIFFRK